MIPHCRHNVMVFFCKGDNLNDAREKVRLSLMRIAFVCPCQALSVKMTKASCL